MKHRILPKAALALFCACAGPTQSPSTPEKPKLSAPQTGEKAAGQVQSKPLRALLVEHWEATMQASPTYATMLGDHRFDDRISDGSPAGYQARRARSRDFLKRARALDASKLSASDRTTLALFVEQLSAGIASEVCRFEQWSISPRGNPLADWNDLVEIHPVRSPADGKSLLARFAQSSKAIDDHLANLELGVKDGLFPNKESTQRVLKMLDDQLAKPVAQWPVMKPTHEKHAKKANWDKEEFAKFKESLTQISQTKLRPALVRYRDFLKAKILPNARDESKSGLVALPLGKACYQARINAYTTLPLTAQQLHQTGQQEIARINAQMQALGKKLFGTDDLAQIIKRLHEDPKLYFETPEQIEKKARDALAAARAKIPTYFGILPKADCVVRKIPDYEAPFTTIAYYRQPVPDGSKPGEYFINVYKPKTRPRFEMEALAFHESIPGHHLQIAISQELGALPAFRKHGGITAFVEGWALYTEQLAEEMGLYSGDLDRMGMLSYEAWRAARLVVDTGIHAMGWSRAQAKAYMAKHTALAANNIDNEVDRYIVWPGQALGYKTGQIEIWKLRKEAEAKLKDKFDIRAFHDAVLSQGAVSLPILRAQIEAWVASKSGA